MTKLAAQVDTIRKKSSYYGSLLPERGNDVLVTVLSAGLLAGTELWRSMSNEYIHSNCFVRDIITFCLGTVPYFTLVQCKNLA